MKEKNADLPIDVMDYILPAISHERMRQQSAQNNEPTQPTVPTESTESTRRTSSKQRKASLDEYRELFLKAPKISDRQPVFVSRTTRDSIDELVRKLGERKMSVSGFLENLANHHRVTRKPWSRTLDTELFPLVTIYPIVIACAARTSRWSQLFKIGAYDE